MAQGRKAVLIKDAMAVPTGSHVKAISLNGKTSSKFIGVTLRKSSQQWQAEIRINGKRKYLGNFSTQVEAAVAYNKAAADTGKPLNILPKGASSKVSASSAKKSSSSSSKKSSKPKKRPQSQSQRKSSVGPTKWMKDSSENQRGGSATKGFSVGKRARVEEGEGKGEKRKSSDHSSSSSSSYSRSEIRNVEETQMTYLALREFGWTHKSAPRKFELQTNWVYLRPGATLKDGAVGTHLFFDEASAVSFAHDWCVGVGGRSGHISELPPTLAECVARDELTLVIERVEEVRGVAEAPLAPSATAFDLENRVDTPVDDKGSVRTASREEADTVLPSIRATEEARDFICCSDAEKESGKDDDDDDDDEVIIGADDFAAELDRAQEVNNTYSGPATPPTPPTPKYVAPNAAAAVRKRAIGSTGCDDDISPLIRSHTTSVLRMPYSPLRKETASIPNYLEDQKQNEMLTTSSSSSSAEVLATPHTPPMGPMFVTPNGPGQPLDLRADSNARWMKAPWIGLWNKSASRAPWSV